MAPAPTNFQPSKDAVNRKRKICKQIAPVITGFKFLRESGKSWGNVPKRARLRVAGDTGATLKQVSDLVKKHITTDKYIDNVAPVSPVFGKIY
jgi:hypothetical protein